MLIRWIYSEMRVAYERVSRHRISRHGLAFSTLSLESVENVMKVVAQITCNVVGGVDFYDIGSGLGNIAMAAEGLPNVVKSVGIEIDADLHAAASDLKRKLGSRVELLNADAMSEKFVVSSERAVVIFAFDLVYTDELVEVIFDKFLESSNGRSRFLVTTKNRQGIGAALLRNTRELIEDTEDALCLIDDDHANDNDFERASRKVYRERRSSSRKVDQFGASPVEGGLEIDVTFGRNVLLNKRDAVCIASPQYECCESDLDSLYLKQRAQERAELHASPDTILEEAKMRFFWITSD